MVEPLFRDPQGPIERFSWGRFTITGVNHSEGGEGVGKDICLIDGQVSSWTARKGHRLKPKMVTCILDQDIDILVIGNGVNGAIKVLKKTQKLILEKGIQELIIQKTPDACRVYNQLAGEGRRVALLAHGTC